MPTRDPLLDESALPFGAPDFARMTPDAFLPAFRRGIEEAAEEIERIAGDPAPPTFANTLEAMERAGARLSRVRRIFWTISSAQSDAAIREIEPTVSEMLTRHGIAVAYNARLFARVRALWERRDSLGLDEAQLRLLRDSYRGFVDGGAELDEARQGAFRGDRRGAVGALDPLRTECARRRCRLGNCCSTRPISTACPRRCAPPRRGVPKRAAMPGATC